MQLLRLRGRKTCERVLRRGRVWRGKHMKITYLRDIRHQKSDIRSQTPVITSDISHLTSHIYVGTIASTKLEKSAVKRNRMRRRCREALRVSLLPSTTYHLPPTQLLISPRSSSLTCAFAELVKDAQNFLTSLSPR